MKKQEEMLPSELAALAVLHSIPGMDAVTVRRDLLFASEAGPLPFDAYYPPGSGAGQLLPAVLIVYGYSDAATPNLFGRTFREMGATVSWARLIAASGMIAIAYGNREPVAGLQAILRHVRDHGSDLGIDGTRLGLWAGSANVPLALWQLMQEDLRDVRCAVLHCGYMLDLDGATSVAERQRGYGFANPCTGKSVNDVRDDVPLLIVRAGRDEFGVNESLDAFVCAALGRDLPVRLINHAGAPHAFDLFHASEETREIVREILRFMQFHLTGPAEAGHYTGSPAEAGHYDGSTE